MLDTLLNIYKQIVLKGLLSRLVANFKNDFYKFK